MLSRAAALSVFCVLLLAACAHGGASPAQAPSPAASPSPNPWAQVKSPSSGHQGPIGFYSAGCLDGASRLELTGRGYQVMRPSRNRNYGDAKLIQFIGSLSDQAFNEKIGVILVGDLAMPRGGPLPTGHASHQIGLDVDIWYLLDPRALERALSAVERETISAVSFVDLDSQKVKKDLWTSAHTHLLKLAATHPDVERIFVNAAIKRELCDTLPENDRAWLQKLRPWFGHDDHFHVRMKCPKGSTLCKAQESVPPGDGCVGNDLAWWFTDEAKAKEKAQPAEAAARKMPVLAPECAAVLGS